MNFNNNTFGLLTALFSALAWSTTGIFVRYLNGFSSIEIIAGRCLIALIFILIIFLISQKPSLQNIWKSRQALGLGTLMAVYFLLVVKAYQMAPVAEVSILTNTTPLFAILYKKIKGLFISIQRVWGIILGMIGVILVIFSGNSLSQFSFGTLNIVGDLMALIAGAAMAVYSIFYHTIPTESKPTSQVASFFTFLVGSILSLFIISLTVETSSIQDFFDSDALYFFLGLGILATLLPTLSYAYASSVLDSVTVTSLRLLTPLLAAFLAIIFLNEVPSMLFWPGAFILLTGLFLIIRSK